MTKTMTEETLSLVRKHIGEPRAMLKALFDRYQRSGSHEIMILEARLRSGELRGRGTDDHMEKFISLFERHLLELELAGVTTSHESCSSFSRMNSLGAHEGKCAALKRLPPRTFVGSFQVVLYQQHLCNVTQLLLSLSQNPVGVIFNSGHSSCFYIILSCVCTRPITRPLK